VPCDAIDNDCVDTPGRIELVGVGEVADLQDGLAAAPAGARIRLCEGLYAGTFTVDRDVTISGVGADVTRIDGRSLGTTIRTSGPARLGLEALTVTGGSESGLVVAASGSATLVDAAVIDNECVFGAGGGIRLGDDGELRLVRTDVTGNGGTWCSEGGGISGGHRVSLTLEDSSVSDNYLSTGVGGGTALASESTLVGVGASAISGNYATFGGGVFIRGLDTSGTLRNLTIEGNAAGYGGGGISASWPGVLELSDLSVLDNVVLGVTGGGVQVDDAIQVTCTRCIVDGNVAAFGAGLNVRSSYGRRCRHVPL
jgi:hypothetical protein